MKNFSNYSASMKNIYVLDCTFHYGWTLSAGEAKPPQADMMSVIKALPQDVAFLAFVLLSLLRGLGFLAYPAGVATLHSMCFSPDKKRVVVELKKHCLLYTSPSPRD